MAVTMQNIADLAGVSRPVVSAVLNGNSKLKVASGTRARILELVNKTGYTRNLPACLLNGQTSRSIALFTNPNDIPLFQELRYQITGMVSAYGYRIMHFPIIMPKNTAEIIEDSLQFGIDGIITIDCTSTVLQREINTPMVSLMRDTVAADVKIDLEQGEYEMTRHILEHGHRRLCLIGNSLSYQPGKVAGFRRACAEYNISPKYSTLLDLTWNTTFAEQLERLLYHDRVTAFVCSCDFIAVRLMGYLSHCGIRVPDDIVLGGYDGDMYACSGPCRITTVWQPVVQMGKLAVEILMEKIRTKNFNVLAKPYTLKPVLHLGESCGCKPPPEKTICWERVINTLEGSNNLIKVPPPELIERYQNFQSSESTKDQGDVE
jgi:DNA-binding LacI/PurR family transcriptional regulator